MRLDVKSDLTEIDITLPTNQYTHVIAFTLHTTDDQFQLDDELQSACLMFVDDAYRKELFRYVSLPPFEEHI